MHTSYHSPYIPPIHRPYIPIQIFNSSPRRMLDNWDNWTCKKHQQEKINFICVGNVWHFEPLCNACLPEHTKNHPKNIKVQLQSIKQIIPKANELKQKAANIFEERLKKCNILSEIKEDEWAYIKSLNQRRQSIISDINTFFDDLISETRKKRGQQQQSQRQSLMKMSEETKQKIAFFKKQDYSDIGGFCNEIKKYYFKDNMQIYVEQVDEVLQEYGEKIIKYDPFVWAKDLSIKLKKFLCESYKAQDQITEKKLVKPQPKKQIKKKQPMRKRCPTCKQQMQYLTEWKKHLVCRNCGNKQRNYVKKG